VKTYFGRVRPIPAMFSKNPLEAKLAENMAINSPIQGTAADIMKLGMLAVHKAIVQKKLKTKIILQVHDELVLDGPENEYEEIQKIVKKAMEDELKIGDAYAYQNPKITLMGQISKFNMSSSKGLTKGYYDIELKVISTNGNSLQVNEYYEFESGYDAVTACKNTSDALMPAVQNLVGKIYRSPQFESLVKPTSK
jgi:hypothetical protein